MSVQATTDGKRILMRTEPFSDQLVRAIKSIPGSNFRKKSDDWSAPLNMDTCRTLRRKLGRDLVVMKPLGDWARSTLEREEVLEQVRSGEILMDMPRVELLAPALWAAIQNRKYQDHGAGFVLEAQHSILGDQPGLGKTLQGLAALVESGAQRILVSCPRTATRNVWEAETAKWAPSISTYVAQGSREDRQRVINRFLFMSKRAGQHMLIINTEMMRMTPEVCPDGAVKKCDKVVTKSLIRGIALQEEGHKHEYNVAEWPVLSETVWNAIIVDEAHNSLAGTSNVQSKNITQVRYGAMHIRYMLERDGMAIAMSGTPFRSRLKKGWGTLNWLLPSLWSSYWQFAETHFGVTEGEYSKEVGDEPLDEEAFQKAIRPYYLARTKAEVAPDLPPIFYAGDTPPDRPDGLRCVFIDMEDRQARAYRDMEQMAIARIQDGEVSAVGVLAELTRLRQFACSYGRMDGMDEMVPTLPSNKIEWLIEFLLERQGNQGKVVVASSFSKLIGIAAGDVAKALGEPVLTLTGATSDRGRTDLVRKFNDPDDPARVLILNSRAGGEAITLDKCADDLVYLDLPWTSDEQAQVDARIHRISRIHNVTVYRLMSRGTIDERMAGMTDEQRRIIQMARPENRKNILEVLNG